VWADFWNPFGFAQYFDPLDIFLAEVNNPPRIQMPLLIRE